VFWVHADNATTFAQDYKKIARRLGVGKLDGEELLAAVRERIESGPPWLLVLDNADEFARLCPEERYRDGVMDQLRRMDRRI
jgi:hypothetical protein